MVLEPLPGRVQRALDRHNAQALRVFADYVRCYVEGLQLEGGGEQAAACGAELPLSGLSAGPAEGGVHALWLHLMLMHIGEHSGAGPAQLFLVVTPELLGHVAYVTFGTRQVKHKHGGDSAVRRLCTLHGCALSTGFSGPRFQLSFGRFNGS